MQKSTRLMPYIVAIAMAAPSLSFAFSLGPIQVESYLGEPLEAQIRMSALKASESNQLSIQLASPQEYAERGIERRASHENLNFKLIKGNGNNYYIQVASNVPITDPFINFLLRVGHGSNAITREYAIFLDPNPMAHMPSNADRKALVKGNTEGSDAVPAVPASATPVKYERGFSPCGENRSYGTYGPVRSGETLYSIAKKTRPSEAISVRDMIKAIRRANSSILRSNNPSYLPKDATLIIPDVLNNCTPAAQRPKVAVAPNTSRPTANRSGTQRPQASPQQQKTSTSQAAAEGSAAELAAASSELTSEPEPVAPVPEVSVAPEVSVPETPVAPVAGMAFDGLLPNGDAEKKKLEDSEENLTDNEESLEHTSRSDDLDNESVGGLDNAGTIDTYVPETQTTEQPEVTAQPEVVAPPKVTQQPKPIPNKSIVPASELEQEGHKIFGLPVWLLVLAGGAFALLLLLIAALKLFSRRPRQDYSKEILAATDETDEALRQFEFLQAQLEAENGVRQGDETPDHETELTNDAFESAGSVSDDDFDFASLDGGEVSHDHDVQPSDTDASLQDEELSEEDMEDFLSSDNLEKLLQGYEKSGQGEAMEREIRDHAVALGDDFTEKGGFDDFNFDVGNESTEGSDDFSFDFNTESSSVQGDAVNFGFKNESSAAGVDAFSFDFTGEPSHSADASDNDAGKGVFDFDVKNETPSAASSTSDAFDFDFDFKDETPSAAPSRSDAFDFDFNTGSTNNTSTDMGVPLGLGDELNNVNSQTTEHATASNAADEDKSWLSFDTEAVAAENTAPPAATSLSSDDFIEVDQDLLAINLDLATSFLATGNTAKARELLEEVMQQGSEELKHKAAEMLKNL